jgi:hypothetical protein
LEGGTASKLEGAERTPSKVEAERKASEGPDLRDSQKIAPNSNSDSSKESPLKGDDASRDTGSFSFVPEGRITEKPTQKVPQMEATTNGAGELVVKWNSDSRKTLNSDVKYVSPTVNVEIAELKARLQILIYASPLRTPPGASPEGPPTGGSLPTLLPAVSPHSNAGKMTSFRKAGGKGFIIVKFEVLPAEAEKTQNPDKLYFSLQVGDEQPRKGGPHSFSNRAMCGLAANHAEWDFKNLATGGTLSVILRMYICHD